MPFQRKLSAVNGVHDVNLSAQQKSGVSLAHGMAKLVAHQPGGFIGHAKNACQLSRIDFFGTTVQKYGLEPQAKRRTASFHNGSRYQGRLFPAMTAFKKRQPARRNGISLRVAAARTTESVRPSEAVQGGDAVVLRLKAAAKLLKRKGFVPNEHASSPSEVGTFVLVK